MFGFARRIFFFLLTNLLVIILLGVILRLVGFSGYLDANGVDLNYEALLVFSSVVGFAGSFISLALSKWMAKRATGAQVISEPSTETEKWLVDRVADLAKRAEIGMPEVAIFPSNTPNAFATGMNRNNALVAVSTGLLEAMTPDETEAVLAHEISHVANGDMITLALMQGIVNTFVVFFSRVIGHTVDRVVFKTKEGHGMGYWITTIFAQIILSVLASMLVMWFSRLREYRADSGAASLTSPAMMIAALERLKGGEPSALPESMAAFGIRPRPSGMLRLLSSHPPLEARIAALQQGQSA